MLGLEIIFAKNFVIFFTSPPTIILYEVYNRKFKFYYMEKPDAANTERYYPSLRINNNSITKLLNLKSHFYKNYKKCVVLKIT